MFISSYSIDRLVVAAEKFADAVTAISKRETRPKIVFINIPKEMTPDEVRRLMGEAREALGD